MTVLPVSSTRSGQLASALWTFYAVSVRRLAHLHSGFLQTTPRGAALAVGDRLLVVKIAHYESNSVLPQGTFTP